nr:unnamed protein product [Callosobruchus analis]
MQVTVVFLSIHLALKSYADCQHLYQRYLASGSPIMA